MVELTGQVALGGAGFSIMPQLDDARAIATIRAGYDAGIRIFDSARAYAPADDPLHNERLFRTALDGRPDVVVATKGGHYRERTGEWRIDNRPDRLRRDIEDSIRALDTRPIGLYFLHRADAQASIGEAVAALDDARRDGLIDGIGISNVTIEQLDEATAIAPISAVQNRHSALLRESDAVLARCEQLAIPFFAYSPLSGIGAGAELARRLPNLAALAAERGVSVQRMAIASLLASSPYLSVVVGAGRPATAKDSAAAVSEAWGDREREALELDQGELSAPK
ncbi:aldo/keto reductase [Lacisediminihabitans changchengi]|uniref:Aldo/keto reductase n=1 Tax=Lacisediminihabitans changchengi TaxID=2787634 RepID=A0A934SQC6_9MICO|nr:aldo/keto reductase [Lacisediminihabitans changchengi]MBK4347108.1 aldo/keto reductase [Lacisediminihabitans changchengi]